MQANTAASRPSLSHLQLFQTPEKHGRPTPSPGPGGGPRGLPRRAGLSQTRPLPSCQAPKFRGHETSLPPSLWERPHPASWERAARLPGGCVSQARLVTASLAPLAGADPLLAVPGRVAAVLEFSL